MTIHRAVVGRPLHPSYSRLTNRAERMHYWNIMRRLWGTSYPGFPSCNPKSISGNGLDTLRSHVYDICLKSDGVRYVLLLTRRMGDDGDGVVALMIDRSQNMYEVEVVAPEAYFTSSTILEGELVWRQPDEQVMIFYVFDAICIRGETITKEPFRERICRAHAAVRYSVDLQDADDVEDQALVTDSIVMTHFKPRIVMRTKHFVAIEHASRLWRDRGDAEHRVDGIIFQDVNAPYHSGTAWDNSCLKWKDHSTVDLRGSPDRLQTVEGVLPSRLLGRTIVVEHSRIVGSDDSILEYHISVTDDAIALMAMRSRPDKDAPNSLKVVEATINDVIHCIKPCDFTTSVS